MNFKLMLVCFSVVVAFFTMPHVVSAAELDLEMFGGHLRWGSGKHKFRCDKNRRNCKREIAWAQGVVQYRTNDFKYRVWRPEVSKDLHTGSIQAAFKMDHDIPWHKDDHAFVVVSFDLKCNPTRVDVSMQSGKKVTFNTTAVAGIAAAIGGPKLVGIVSLAQGIYDSFYAFALEANAEGGWIFFPSQVQNAIIKLHSSCKPPTAPGGKNLKESIRNSKGKRKRTIRKRQIPAN